MLELWANPMRMKYIRIFLILILSTTFLVLVLLRYEDYRLNRTVRESVLNLMQISHLSLKTRAAYKVIFQDQQLRIDVFDRDLAKWKKYQAWPYKKGIICNSQGWEFIFSRGSFKEYRLSSWSGKVPKYIIVQFQLESSSKRKGIIFYQDGHWRVLS